MIVTGNGILATQRSHGEFKDKWEFPGGKIEPGETPEQALKREIKEELDVDISIDSYIEAVHYSYTDFEIKLYVFVCSVASGNITLKEHKSSEWLKTDELDSMEWLPADKVVLPALKRYFDNVTVDKKSLMPAYTYIEKGHFALTEKHVPHIVNSKDAIVRVTLGSICTSDLHIKHGSVPRAVPGITVGHEMVGVVEQVGSLVSNVKPGDRVTVNCFFYRNGYVNNCEDPDGGWALGCRIDGGQTEYVRVPHADMGLNRIPDGVTLL